MNRTSKSLAETVGESFGKSPCNTWFPSCDCGLATEHFRLPYNHQTVVNSICGGQYLGEQLSELHIGESTSVNSISMSKISVNKIPVNKISVNTLDEQHQWTWWTTLDEQHSINSVRSEPHSMHFANDSARSAAEKIRRQSSVMKFVCFYASRLVKSQKKFITWD